VASVTYFPLKTTSSVIIKAANGTEPGVSKADQKTDPIISFLAAWYKF
jgi:outer membrane protein